jgi:hypothetical protein
VDKIGGRTFADTKILITPRRGSKKVEGVNQ